MVNDQFRERVNKIRLECHAAIYTEGTPKFGINAAKSLIAVIARADDSILERVAEIWEEQ